VSDDVPEIPSARWTDHQVDQVIGRVLQIGVFIATVVVVAGTIGLLSAQGGSIVDHRVFVGAAPALRSIGSIVRGALAGRPDAITQLGLVLLIATPIARVALTLGAFLIQRDRLYVVLTAIVLALLLWGLVAG
jgi:uncharacterized membrane protein